MTALANKTSLILTLPHPLDWHKQVLQVTPIEKIIFFV